ncbi:MAG: methyltransferase [Vulcanimicrobiota bacterium]
MGREREEYITFLSYAWNDDRDWTTHFGNLLESILQQFSGQKMMKIFRDLKLRSDKILSEGIREALDCSSSLTCVMSPSYLKSQWCQNELSYFQEYHPTRPIFLVTAIPVEGIDGRLHHPFWNYVQERGRYKRIKPTDDEFHEIVEYLGQDILEALGLFEPPGGAPKSHTAVSLLAEEDRTRLASGPLPTASEKGMHLEVAGPHDLQQVVLYNFNRKAQAYFRSLLAPAPMQSQNALELLRMIEKYCEDEVLAYGSRWLDVGCGTGLVLALMRDCQTAPPLNDIVTLGLDYSSEMIRLSKEVAAYNDVVQLDVVEMDAEKLGQPFDCVVANNVFHWLLDLEKIRRAMKNCASCLRHGGILAASIAGRGTGKAFFQVYRETMAELLDGATMANWKSHIDNPIGLQALSEIVDLALPNDFTVVEARLRYEPVVYKNPEMYVEAARAYGEFVFTAPFLGLNGDALVDQFWRRLKEKFRQLWEQSPAAERLGGRYLHDQYMIYVLYRKR